MTKVPATEFKAKCLELMDRVAERHETYVITKHGRPVAQLVPIKRDPKERILGWLRTEGSIAGDVLAPAASLSTWESLREWEELKADEPRRKAKDVHKGHKRRRPR